MLVGARQAGFDIVGNIEWRRYYHAKDSEGRNTFSENFPGAIWKFNTSLLTDEETNTMTGVDIALGHPECGAFSNLRNVKSEYKDPCDIPLFVDLIAKFRPKFFMMDDLPPSFVAFPMSEYVDRLSDYDLFPEWVSNYGYGNVQKHRKRMFMIGSLKSEKWVFRPGEEDNDQTVSSVIGDLWPDGGHVPNHDNHSLDGVSNCDRSPVGGPGPKYLTWEELHDWFMDRPEGTIFSYTKTDGTEACKFGLARTHWEAHCHVLHGGRPIVHPLRGYPFTIRERARIQGFPDDFVFYGTKYDDKGLWNHEKNSTMIKQTGKAMPVQFCQFVSKQIAAHLRGEKFECSGRRTLSPNKYVDEAKKWYCANVGYADQIQACKECWMYDRCEIRGPRYGIGGEAVESEASRKYELKVVESKIAPRKEEPTTAEESKSSDVPKKRSATTARKVCVDRKVSLRSGAPTYLEVVESKLGHPDDYQCRCQYCVNIVELIRGDGRYYSRNDRKEYYSPIETAKSEGSGHIAKTPLHVARWAIQQYTKPGEWVLDPTAGAGTTLVEAVVSGRNAIGIEIQTAEVVKENVAHAKKISKSTSRAIVVDGDARNIDEYLSKLDPHPSFSLIVNNPPYSGDESQVAKGSVGYEYDRTKKNLAFLDENDEYYQTLEDIYRASAKFLISGGRFVMAVKDQMRSKVPDQLHEKIGDVLRGIGLVHESTAVLNHYPRTLHLNTYFLHHGVHPPYYQSILVFRKIARKVPPIPSRVVEI